MPSMTSESAMKVLTAALDKANALDSPSSIAVLDSGRELIAFARLDDAPLASVEISQNKAYTAVSMKMATADLGPVVQPGAPFYGLQTAQARPFVTFGGGLPIVADGVVIGSIGVAGGSSDQDIAIATAGAEALA